MTPRVVVYSPWYFPTYVGGGERLAQLTADGLRTCGADVIVLTHGPEAREYAFDDVPVHVIASDRLADGAREVFRRFRPTHVHGVGSWASTDVQQAARDAGALVGAAGLDYGQFCDNHRLVRGGGGPCSGRVSAKECFKCHLESQRGRDRVLGRLGWQFSSVIEIAEPAIARMLQRRRVSQFRWAEEFRARERRRRQMNEQLDLFVAPTAFAATLTHPHMAGRTRCATLMYPADATLRPVAKSTPPSTLSVGFVGRALRIKGAHLLLDAADRLGDAVRLHLRLATNNEEADYWRPLKSRAASMPNVEWAEPGVLNADDLRRFHAAIDVLAVPSLWPEYVGFVTLEALALGTPVILSDFSAQRELLDAESGTVVTPGDVAALTSALRVCHERKTQGLSVRPHSPAIPAAEYARQLLRLYETARA